MSLIAIIRAAIVATLNTVPGIGKVHDYERYAQAEKAFRDLYQSGDRILGWHVRRLATRTVVGTIGIGMQISRWRIVGFMSLADATASEKSMDDLVETVTDAFIADQTLGGAVMDTCDMSAGEGQKESGIQLESSEPVMFAGVLCHRVMLGLTTSNAIQY